MKSLLTDSIQQLVYSKNKEASILYDIEGSTHTLADLKFFMHQYQEPDVWELNLLIITTGNYHTHIHLYIS
jgi:hypothetical protein